MQRLQQNLFFKLLSLACAFGLFLYVRKAESTNSDELLVPLSFKTDPGVEVVAPTDPRYARVVLRGPANLIRGVKPADITARVDLTGRRTAPVPSPVPIQVELAPHLRDRLEFSYTPSQVRVRLDENVTRYFQVTPSIEAQLPAGQTTGVPSVHPEQVAISGLSAVVNRVKQVRAIVTEINGAGVLDVLARVSVVDEAGTELREKLQQIQPPTVRVRVPLERKVWTKNGVHVYPKLAATAPGLVVAEMTVRPNRVDVTGTDSVLADLWVLDTETIELPTMPGPFERFAAVVIPEGLTRVDPRRVRVSVVLARAGMPSPSRRLSPPPEPEAPAGERRPGE